MVKNAIDGRTGRGVGARVLHNTEDVEAVERILGYVTNVIDEFKVGLFHSSI